MKTSEIIMLIVGTFLIGLGCFLLGQSSIQNQAIQHGFAEYNQTNGNWQWKSGGGK